MDEDRLKRHDLTDEEWARLDPLLPAQNVHGARWSDHRVVINGIFHESGAVMPSWRPGARRYMRVQVVSLLV